MKKRGLFIQPLLITTVVMLFLGAFLGLPYGYYTLLRLIVFIASALIALAAYKIQKHGWMIGVGLIVLIFNPFVPVHFDKATWRAVDIIVAVVFLILFFKINSEINVR